MTALDTYDLAILRILQRDNHTPQRRIGEQVNLSAPAVQRRIRRMEAEGVILANVARVSPDAVGLPLTIIVAVELVSETPDAIDAAKKRFREAPEIQLCHYVTGEADFILVVSVASMAAYEDFTRRMFFDGANVRKFRTSVSMGQVKADTALPL